MEMEKPLADVSYLPVQEDYEAFQAAKRRWRATPKEKLLTRAVGLVFFAVSAVFFAARRSF